MGSIGLNTGLQALLTAQHALDTVGNNIANAATPGYSRQRVDLASGIGIDRGNVLIGTGVVARDLSRVVDNLLNKRIVGQLSVVGRLEQQLDRANQIQALFGDLQGVGIGQMMDGFFDELSSLSIDPSDPVRRSSVVQTAGMLTSRFNEVSAGLLEAQTSTRGQAQIVVQQINDLAAQIANLNVQIAETEAGQVSANSLRDQRQQLLEQLSELTDVQAKDTGVGGLRVHVGGALLVDSATSLQLQLAETEDGGLDVEVQGSGTQLQKLSGKLGALLGVSNEFVGGLQDDLNGLASELILEVNRAHTTGVPGNGPFNKLVGVAPLQPAYQGSVVEVQKLADSGLPFDVQAGTLTINVHDLDTGEIAKHEVAVDPEMLVQDLIDSISSIPDVTAYVDDAGRFTMTSSSGHAFDFSNVVQPSPDLAGTFGGTSASIGSQGAEPFALAAGQTLDMTVVSGGVSSNFTITLDASDFADITNATAEEVAAVLNAHNSFSSSGAVATAQDGHLFVQTLGSGTGESITLHGGSALTGLGLDGLTGVTTTGSLDDVGVEIGGSYKGSSDETYTLVPVGDGQIGSTPGLAVEVHDSNGQVVATIDVGEGYVPGTPLQIAEGLTASFGIGELSASAGDRISFEATADSDTSDVLVALGLNTFFKGSDASDIAVRDEVLDDPQLFAASATGSSGDNGVLLEMLELQNASLESLGGQDFGDRYGEMIADVGFRVNTAESSLTSSTSVLDSLRNRRDSVSGVNVDEELVNMIRFEQSFQAASRYLAALNELEDSILALI